MEHEVYKHLYEAQQRFWWHKGMREFFDVFLSSHVGTARKNTNAILDS